MYGENEMPRVSYWICIDYTPLRWGPVRRVRGRGGVDKVVVVALLLCESGGWSLVFNYIVFLLFRIWWLSEILICRNEIRYVLGISKSSLLG